MSRNPRIRVTAFAAVLALALSPMANALPANAGAVDRSESAWFETALRWVEDLAGVRRPTSGRHGNDHGARKETKSSNGGSCIDPMGNPRPWCA
jgi:hypothetical protein